MSKGDTRSRIVAIVLIGTDVALRLWVIQSIVLVMLFSQFFFEPAIAREASEAVDATDLKVIAWRVAALEQAVIDVRSDHARILWLLIGNLAAVVTSIVVHWIDRHKRGRY